MAAANRRSCPRRAVRRRRTCWLGCPGAPAARPGRGGSQGQQATASRQAPAHRPVPASQQDPPGRPGDDFAGDPGPYDSEPASQDDGGDSLTGMDLIQRELGGKVIEELGDG